MSSPSSLWNGFFIMIAGILVSVLLMATIGQIGDKMITTMLDINVLNAFNPEWAGSFDKIYTFQSFLFIVCLMPGFFGIIIYILSAVRRQKYDTYENGGQMPQIDYSRGYK